MKQSTREEATSYGDSADELMLMTSSVTSSSRKNQKVACIPDARGSDVVEEIQSQATVQSADAIWNSAGRLCVVISADEATGSSRNAKISSRKMNSRRKQHSKRMRRRFVVATGSPAARRLGLRFVISFPILSKYFQPFVPYLSNPRTLFSRELFRRFPIVPVVVLARARLLPESSGFLAGLVVAQFKILTAYTLQQSSRVVRLNAILPKTAPDRKLVRHPTKQLSLELFHSDMLATDLIHAKLDTE
ncbi:hypothetical protein F511_35584 [Dorcoceras hygrometricum]|uniref:Uncharacterized protein n=1 Tax=Dorcoceras hygrometricum TaxID=472368 RepID=A0A2Z7C4L3_9LAMI|nr:hypothetical protein F511_35584 [Dorcoceras hygrometricum]